MYSKRVEKKKEPIRKSFLARRKEGMTLGTLFREGNVVQVMDAIFVNDSNAESWQIQDEAFLELQRNMKEISQQIFIEHQLWARFC